MSKSLKRLNEHIFDALDKLSSAKDIEEIKTEIQRCNAISNGAKTVVEELKIGLEIAKLQEKGNDYTDYVIPSLGLDDDEE